jgi:hypothetical protein
MSAFWEGFEKRSASRWKKEVAEAFGKAIGTGKKLTPKDISHPGLIKQPVFDITPRFRKAKEYAAKHNDGRIGYEGFTRDFERISKKNPTRKHFLPELETLRDLSDKFEKSLKGK